MNKTLKINSIAIDAHQRIAYNKDIRNNNSKQGTQDMAFFIFAQDFARNAAYSVGYQLGRQCGLGYADMTPCPYDDETLAQEWQWGVNSGRCDS